MWTSHGHHISGTRLDDPNRPDYVGCGGLGECATCATEAVHIREVLESANSSVRVRSTAASIPRVVVELPPSLPDRARKLVYDYMKATSPVVPALSDIYVVWFSKTLQNWKALISTSVSDGMYYEITYDGARKQTYLDAYRKVANVSIPDHDQGGV